MVYDSFNTAKGLPAKPSRILTQFAGAVKSLAVSPDGKAVAYCGYDPAVDVEPRLVIADAATGETIREVPKKSNVLALSFSPDSRNLATLDRDPFVRLVRVEPRKDGDEAEVWSTRLQRGPRGAIAFSPDGKLVAASSSAVLDVLDAATGKVQFKLDRYELDDGIFQQVAFSPDSRLLITGSAGMPGAVHVFEVATRTLVRRFNTGLGAIQRLVVFPDGRRAVSAGAEEAITLWDLSFRSGKDAPSQEDLVRAWNALDSLDAARGFPAVRMLAAGGAAAERVIAAGLDETLETQRKIAGLVKDLGSEEFIDREASTRALEAYGYRALAAVRAAAGSDSEEVRTRVASIVDRLKAKGIIWPEHGLASDTLRLVRTAQVLEELGGDDARSLLERIETFGGRPAETAKAALGRMRK
jgi:hypothetical protein